jgi:predicted NBD/HSP70 family sugar kinase
VTPEERAAKFSWAQCPGGEGHDAGDDGHAYSCARCHADLIRAAEDEALERAAGIAERAARNLRASLATISTKKIHEAATIVGGMGAADALAEAIRSHKSGSAK